MNESLSLIAQTILIAYPCIQTIYLYGTWDTAHQRPDSDIDIAVLLPPTAARAIDHSAWSHLATKVAATAQVERADLVNVRAAPTLLCKEVIAADRRIHCADTYAADEFEMLTLLFYQKLNEERREMVEDSLSSSHFYHV